MKKYFFILLLTVLALPAFAQKHKLIYYGVLDSSLNGNGYSITNLTNVTASSFVGNGASLTNLTASSLVGQVPTASLSNGTNLLLGGGGIAVTRLGSTNVIAGNVLAAGSGVTIIQSTNGTDGTVTNTVFTSGTNAYPQDVRFSTAFVTNTLTVNGTINAPSFQTTAGGTAIFSGANFTVVNGTSVFASGGVETARFQGGYVTLAQYVKVDPDGALHAADSAWSIGNDGSINVISLTLNGGDATFGGGNINSVNNISGSGASALSGFDSITANTLNGALFGDGSGITNVQASNIAHTLTQTNIVIGQLYTNTATAPVQICGLAAALVEAAIAGRASVSVGISGQFTNTPLAAITAITGTVVGSDTNALPTYIVPAGSTYKFTDTSTGAGNSVTLVGGQIFK